MKTKPKRWIERLNTVCKDHLHNWLMHEFGFEKYIKLEAWKLEDIEGLFLSSEELYWNYFYFVMFEEELERKAKERKAVND